MIRKLSGESPAFVLDTRNTSYAFKIMETGQPEHLYYGAKITVNEMADLEALSEKRAFQQGNSIAYDQEHLSFTLEDVSLEMSGYGKGDIREPFVEVVAADGSFTTDFVYA
jgi:alpha-galactosidase